MLVELLIFCGKSRLDRDFDPKHLDIIDIRPAGFAWGTEERERCFLIKANLTQEQVDNLLRSEFDISNPRRPRLIRYRSFYIDISELPMPIQNRLNDLANDTNWNIRRLAQYQDLTQTFTVNVIGK